MMMRWHQKTIDQVVSDLHSSRQGLSETEAERRLVEYGRNVLAEKPGKTPLAMFLDQFKDFMILVLIGAAFISWLIGDVTDTIAIAVIVVLNATIGFVQEYRAERAMAALKKMAAPTATVIREGIPAVISAGRLVPGEVVALEAGTVVPADMRVVESARLKLEEAALTGESMPVEKHTEALHEETLSLGDRNNMVYKGTVVSYGRGRGIVVATGMETELGRIAAMLQEEEEVKTPLQKRLTLFGQKLAIAVLAICALVFGVGILRGEPVVLMFLTAISLAVAAIPEALPAVVTISLALGARKMARQNALIRKLPAVETLGSVTYICTDKTGTLTLNKMTAEEIYVDGRIIKGAITDLRPPPLNPPLTKGGTKGGVESGLSPEKSLMTAMALSNDASPDAGGNILGDPTEVALYLAAEKAGFKKMILKKDNERVSEIPFDSDRKCMTTVHINPSDGFRSFTKGGVEIILDKSVNILTSGGVKGIERGEIIKVSERMAADGLRVLAVGTRRWDAVPGKMIPEEVENGLTLLGLVG